MSNSGLNKNIDTVISALNNKYDTSHGIQTETTANDAQTTAEAAKTAAEAAQTVANAAATLINTTVDEINKDLENTKTEVNNNLTIAKSELNSSLETTTNTINSTINTKISEVNQSLTDGYFHKMVENNYTPSSDTPSEWANKRPGRYWYSISGKLNDQPSQYGHLLNLGYLSEVFQIWYSAPSGPLYYRGGNMNGWNNTTWKRIDNPNMFPEVVVFNVSDCYTGSMTLPNYGTWAALFWDTNLSDFHGYSGYYAGGSVIGGFGTYKNGIAIRIA